MSCETGERSMDHETNDLPLRSSHSLGRSSTSSSSVRRLSFSVSGRVHPQLDEDAESEIVSQAGDIGDRALSSRRNESSGLHFLVDNVSETVVVTKTEDASLHSYGFWPRDPEMLNSVSHVTPLASDVSPPLSRDAVLHSEEDEKSLLPSLEYISCLIHLAFFGHLGYLFLAYGLELVNDIKEMGVATEDFTEFLLIVIWVLTKYLLQKLFGPGVVGVTSETNILYLDLPSNMVGSFLMGWLGVVFKGNISHFSDQLAIGLTTGYLGSLTTLSGWNQKMLDLSVTGHWVLALLGYLIGLFLAAYSIIFGIETAQGFRWLIRRIKKDSSDGSCCFKTKWRVNSCKHHLVVIIALMVMWGSLWVVSVILEKEEFKNGGSGAQLWLACLVAPLGVWIRWWLARLNGRGLGKRGWFKWIPLGTLIANVSAACIVAVLATIKKAVKTQDCDTVASGIQFGLLGCLSTVSTFIAEFNAMRLSNHTWRAYAYAIITFGISFVLGTLLYSVPVWTKAYE